MTLANLDVEVRLLAAQLAQSLYDATGDLPIEQRAAVLAKLARAELSTATTRFSREFWLRMAQRFDAPPVCPRGHDGDQVERLYDQIQGPIGDAVACPSCGVSYAMVSGRWFEVPTTAPVPANGSALKEQMRVRVALDRTRTTLCGRAGTITEVGPSIHGAPPAWAMVQFDGDDIAHRVNAWDLEPIGPTSGRSGTCPRS